MTSESSAAAEGTRPIVEDSTYPGNFVDLGAPMYLSQGLSLDGLGNTHNTDHSQAHIIPTQIHKQELQERTIILENIHCQDNFDTFKQKLTTKLQKNEPYAINKTTEKTVKITIPLTNKHHENIATILMDPQTFTNITDKYPHVYDPQIDTRPWLCINKAKCETQLQYENIIEQLKNANIDHTALHYQTGTSKSSLIKFKLTNHNEENLKHALKTFITTPHHTTRPRIYIEKQIQRCTKCHKLDHTKKHCTKKKQTCVICAGNCPTNQCKNPKNKKCVNCHQPHASSFSNCPAIRYQKKNNFKQAINDMKIQATASASAQFSTHQLTTIGKQIDTVREVNQQIITTLQEKQTQDANAHSQIIEELRNEIQELRQTQTTTKQEMETKHKQEIETLKNDLRRKANKEIDTMKQELKVQAQTHKEEMDKLRDKLTKDLEQIEEERETMQTGLLGQELTHKKEMEKLKEELNGNLKVAEETHIQDINKKFQEKDKELRDTFTQAIDKHLKKQYNELKKDLTEHIDNELDEKLPEEEQESDEETNDEESEEEQEKQVETDRLTHKELEYVNERPNGNITTEFDKTINCIIKKERLHRNILAKKDWVSQEHIDRLPELEAEKEKRIKDLRDYNKKRDEVIQVCYKTNPDERLKNLEQYDNTRRLTRSKTNSETS